MSVSDVVARVQELHQLIGGRSSAPAPAQGHFAATLAGASQADPAANAAAAAASPLGLAVNGASGVGNAAPGSVTGVPFADEINAAAARHKLDPTLLAGLIRQESNFNPGAVSPAGARGLTQLMPGTAAALGVRDSSDPVQAIEGGARYLREQLDRFDNDPARALAAYNAGPGAVLRHGGVPPYAETQAYVRKVQEFAAEYRRSAVAAPVTPLAAPAVNPALAAAAVNPALALGAAGVNPALAPRPAGSQARGGGLGYSTL